MFKYKHRAMHECVMIIKICLVYVTIDMYMGGRIIVNLTMTNEYIV